MVVRCTRRLLGLVGSSVSLFDVQPSEEDWYANLLWIERRKCLLLTHAGTLFSIFAPDIRAAEVRALGPYLARLVEEALRLEGLPADALGSIDQHTLRVATTASRSVLGTMSNMAVQIEYAVASARGLGWCDVDAVNRQLRRTPLSRGGTYVYAIDLVVARSDGADG
jgi:hypothetical protein